MAEFAKEQGVKKVYILNDKEAYGLGVATNPQGRRVVGIEIVGFEAWDPKASSYEVAVQEDPGDRGRRRLPRRPDRRERRAR